MRVKKQPGGIPKNVQEFARKFYDALDKDGWGDMEPEIFRNIAEGHTKADDEDLHMNKFDPGEMESAVAGMVTILRKVLR